MYQYYSYQFFLKKNDTYNINICASSKKTGTHTKKTRAGRHPYPLDRVTSHPLASLLPSHTAPLNSPSTRISPVPYHPATPLAPSHLLLLLLSLQWRRPPSSAVVAVADPSTMALLQGMAVVGKADTGKVMVAGSLNGGSLSLSLPFPSSLHPSSPILPVEAGAGKVAAIGIS